MEITVIHPDFVKNFPNELKNVQIKIFDSICKVWMITQKSRGCPEMRFQESFCKKFYIFETWGYKRIVDLKNELIHYIDNNGTYPTFGGITIEIRRNKNGSNQIWFIVPKSVYECPYNMKNIPNSKERFEEKLEEEYNSKIVQALRQIADTEIKNLSSIVDKDRVTKVITDLYCLLDKCFINHKITLSTTKNEIHLDIQFNCNILRVREIDFVCSKYPRIIKSVIIDVERMRVLFVINKNKKRKRDEEGDEELHDDNDRKTKKRKENKKK
jgi:hypothetical protein